MDEAQRPGSGDQPVATRMSLAARLTNVFVAPGEVFAEVKDSPPTPANWLAPMIITILAGIIYSIVVFSQPAVIQGIKETREKQFQKQVTAGKMTQSQADKMMEATEKYVTPVALMVFGFIITILGTVVGLFLWALFVWLIGRFGLKGQMGYMTAVELVGLCMMISALGAIIAMLLAVIYGNPAMKPSPILLLSHYDDHNRIHAFLAALDVTTLWNLAVLSLGLGLVSGRGFARAAAWIYGLWVFITVGMIWLLVGRWG